MKSFNGALVAVVLVSCISLVSCATVNKSGDQQARLKEPRIKPLAESEWNAEQQRLLGPLKGRGGRVININTTMAHHPKMMARFLTFSLYILRESTLPPRDREILVLRTGWLCRSEYEFGQHTLVGKAVGVTPNEIMRITKGPDAPGWGSFDATLIRAADELHLNTFISDATWNTLAKRYSQQQMMDLVMTVGQYNLVCMFLNTFGVPLDQGVPGFPK
jgi:4-carboxymuconolactone decarboxylase